jgi:hypothetical protein
MTRVALIVTGDVEYGALHASLQRAFPSLTFEQHASPPGRPMNGFTSSRIPASAPVLERTARSGEVMLSEFARLIDQLILAVHPGRNGDPYDHAILIDDLELVNADQPERVIAWVREAVPRRIDAQWPSQAKRDHVRDLVRDRCSFHLLCPMVESLFFGEPAALDRAGRVTGRASQFDANVCDIEAFEVTDGAYETVAVPAVAGKASKGDWRRSPELRKRHPKKYLQYLGDASLDGNTRYAETTTGAAALATLDWTAVLQNATSARYARSLIADIAAMTRVPASPKLSLGDSACAPLTWSRARDRVLRNV